jgi:hypothetical protein
MELNYHIFQTELNIVYCTRHVHHFLTQIYIRQQLEHSPSPKPRAKKVRMTPVLHATYSSVNRTNERDSDILSLGKKDT